MTQGHTAEAEAPSLAEHLMPVIKESFGITTLQFVRDPEAGFVITPLDGNLPEGWCAVGETIDQGLYFGRMVVMWADRLNAVQRHILLQNLDQGRRLEPAGSRWAIIADEFDGLTAIRVVPLD